MWMVLTTGTVIPRYLPEHHQYVVITHSDQFTGVLTTDVLQVCSGWTLTCRVLFTDEAHQLHEAHRDALFVQIVSSGHTGPVSGRVHPLLVQDLPHLWGKNMRTLTHLYVETLSHLHVFGWVGGGTDDPPLF